MNNIAHITGESHVSENLTFSHWASTSPLLAGVLIGLGVATLALLFVHFAVRTKREDKLQD